MYAIGADLGTTYTAAATWSGGRAEVVHLGEHDAVPSVVLLDDHGRVVIGDEADRRSSTNPERVARAFKRRFGDDVPLLIAGLDVTPERLTTDLLRWVVNTIVGTHDHKQPERVTLTVPATWQGYRLQLMYDVVEEAGLHREQTRFVPEPAAAAVFYAGHEQVAAGSTVGVYDFGGGTFDATLLRKTAGGFEIVGVPLGSDSIGGIDLDHLVLRRVVAAIGPAWNALDRNDPAVRAGLAALSAAVVRGKETLSIRNEAVIPIRLPGCPDQAVVTRTDLETDAEPFVLRTADIMRDVITEAGLTPTELNRILLVGGSSRMPLVSRILSQELGVTVATDTHPKYAVCLGAAIAAGSLLQAAEPPPAVTRQPQPPAVPPVPGPPATAATSIVVDLKRAGLTDAASVPVRPAAELRRRPRSPANEILAGRIDADEAYASAAHRTLVITAILVVLAAAIVVLMATLT